MPNLKTKYTEEVAPALMQKFNYKSTMQIPRIEKIVVNCGCGEARDNAKVLESVVSDLATITGQKPIITKAKKKRSLEANSYFWQLLDKIANSLGRDKEDLYLDYVKRVGPFKDFVLTEDEAKTFRVAWSMLGTGWPTEQVDYSPSGRELVIRAYYGSSQYNNKQMSRLIDTVVEDAKALGIETLTPMELSRLKEEWHGRD